MRQRGSRKVLTREVRAGLQSSQVLDLDGAADGGAFQNSFSQRLLQNFVCGGLGKANMENRYGWSRQAFEFQEANMGINVQKNKSKENR